MPDASRHRASRHRASQALDLASLSALVEGSPYHRWLGVRLAAASPEGVEILLPWREELVGSAEARTTHGGVLAGLIDLAADYAIAARLGRGVPTVDLRIDYHRSALPGPLLARASVIKLGGTVATAEARIFDAQERLLASGRGVYLTATR